MSARIEAFYGPSSPRVHFGEPRLYDIAGQRGCGLVLLPIRVVEENCGTIGW